MSSTWISASAVSSRILALSSRGEKYDLGRLNWPTSSLAFWGYLVSRYLRVPVHCSDRVFFAQRGKTGGQQIRLATK